MLKKLDSTLKKNTAFIKKIRLVGPDNIAALLEELNKVCWLLLVIFISFWLFNLLVCIHKLNMSRYMSELAAAVVDSRLKQADIFPVHTYYFIYDNLHFFF